MNPRGSRGPFSIDPGGPGACTRPGSVATSTPDGRSIDTRSAVPLPAAFEKAFAPIFVNGVSDCRYHSAVFGAASVTASLTVKDRAPSQVNVRVSVFRPAAAGYAAPMSATT